MTFAIDTSVLHPSSRLGLAALAWLAQRTEFDNALDMGCGSGVLSVMAAQLWAARILAVDISENAVRDATQVIDDHELTERITVIRSDRFAHPAIATHAPYGLIMANMLDQWLVEMATDMKKHLRPGGTIILSGLLEWLAAGTRQAYIDLGFEIQQEFSDSGWRAVIMAVKP
ncbi:MAG: 50S ribosomal protein L11 methyltransferase [Alphaproteobacteria bacterium]